MLNFNDRTSTTAYVDCSFQFEISDQSSVKGNMDYWFLKNLNFVLLSLSLFCQITHWFSCTCKHSNTHTVLIVRLKIARLHRKNAIVCVPIRVWPTNGNIKRHKTPKSISSLISVLWVYKVVGGQLRLIQQRSRVDQSLSKKLSRMFHRNAIQKPIIWLIFTSGLHVHL